VSRIAAVASDAAQGVEMATLPPYHIGEQSAAALLRPVRARLREEEARVDRYLSRLRLAGEADRAALAAAQAALVAAQAALVAAGAAIEHAVAGGADTPEEG
jgi:hypothetical protein